MATRTQSAGPVRRVVESVIVGAVVTGASYLVGLAAGWVSAATLNGWEVFAVLTSYSCTYLCVHERRINYPIGAVSSAAYAYLFFSSGLLSSAVLNAYLVPTLVYGWIRWRRDAVTRPVTRVRARWVPVYLGAALLGWAGAALLGGWLGGSMAWTDSVILAGSILAQFLLDNKKLETWAVWAVVNVLAIYTYASSGLALVAFQYVFFLANTVYGYLTWRRSMNHEGICADDGDAADDGALAVTAIRDAGC